MEKFSLQQFLFLLNKKFFNRLEEEVKTLK